MNKDRRREARIYEEDKIVLNVVPNGGLHAFGPAMFSLTQDVSAGGFRIVSDVPIEVGTAVRVEIGLSKSRRVMSGTAKVRWLNRLFEDGLYEMGLEFVDMSPENMGIILEHVYKSGAR